MLRTVAALMLAVFGPPVHEDAPVAHSVIAEHDPTCDPPEPGFLTLETLPWTVVYVDGVYAGSTPLFRAKLTPGEHTLTLVNEAAQLLTHEDIVVDEGRTRRLKLVLQAEETDTALDASADTHGSGDDCIVPDDELAWLSVDTKPWSRVFLDGKRVGSTPLFQVPLARGEHVVRLEREDGTSAFARFTAIAGETVRLSIALGAPREPGALAP